MKQIIIAGCPRSGTTALAALLSHDKNTWVMNENGCFCWEEKEYPEHFKEWMSKQTTLTDLERKGIDGEQFARTFSLAVPRSLPSDIAQLYNLEVVGDKLPGYLSMIEDISNENPDAYIILTFRSCLHFIVSSTNHYNAGQRSLWNFPSYEQAADFWEKENTELLIQLGRLIKNRRNVFLIKYEKYADNAEKLLEDLSNFIGYQFDIVNPSGGYHKFERKIPDYQLTTNQRNLMDVFGYV